MISVKFEGINKKGQPMFKSIVNNDRYGALNKLFYKYATKKEVLKDVQEKDLVYFGRTKDCIPMGTKVAGLYIIRGEL